MSKSERIAELAKEFKVEGIDPRYAGYFVLFNRQQFYEAHDVLEDLWLPDRRGPDGNFYKGLIQLAGAFVHLQKGRLKPSSALFKLAQNNLQMYPANHHRLDVVATLNLINEWNQSLESGGFTQNPIESRSAPKIDLLP